MQVYPGRHSGAAREKLEQTKQLRSAHFFLSGETDGGPREGWVYRTAGSGRGYYQYKVGSLEAAASAAAAAEAAAASQAAGYSYENDY